MQRFIAAYRRKVPPPTYLVRPMFQSLVPILRDAAIVSYYRGMEFVYVSAPKQTSIVFAFKDVKREQQKRFRFPVADTRAMQQFYDAEALVILNRVSDKQERVLRESMIDITRRNLHVKEGVAEIEKSFAKAGIIPHNSYEAENIFRTQTQLAYAAGQYAAEQDPAIQAILRGYKYVSVGDARVRQTHADLHGLILHKNDAAWHTITPPNGFSCRCMRIPIFDDRKFSTGFDPEIINAGPDKGFDFHPGELAPVNAGGTYKSWIENKAKVGGTYKGQKMPLEWWQGKLAQYESKAFSIAQNPLIAQEISSVKLGKAQVNAAIEELQFRADTVIEFEKGVTLSQKRVVVEALGETLEELESLGISVAPDRIVFRTTPIGGNKNIQGQFSKGKLEISLNNRIRGKLDVTGNEWGVEESMKGTLRHEFGHSLSSESTRTAWAKIAKNKKFSPSGYGTVSADEMFAESFSAYTSSQYATTAKLRLAPEVESFFVEHYGKHPNLAKVVEVKKVTKKIAKSTSSLGSEFDKQRVKTHKKWTGSLTVGEKEAFVDYTGDFSSSMRHYDSDGKFKHRGWNDMSKDSADKVNNLMNQALKRAPVQSETLWRGINVEEDVLEKWKKGSKITLNTWTSTTSESKVAEEFLLGGKKPVMFKFEAKRSVSIDALSQTPGEKEFLLVKGQRFKVQKIEKETRRLLGGKVKEVTTIHLEEL